MNKNEFIVNTIYGGVSSQPVISGQILIDCDHEELYETLKKSSENYDNTFNKPILKEEFVYLPDFPSNVISYSEMLIFGKNKYFWDSLNQKLYKFLVQDNIKPFVSLKQKAVGTEGNPTQVVDTLREFSKSDGVFNEVELEIETSNYITVHGHPAQYAERPYREDIYYFDDVHGLYYLFTSNYTLNINNLYFDKTSENTLVLQYVYDSNAWKTINSALVLNGNPNDLLHIVDGSSESSGDIDINEINQEIYYCDKISSIIYQFSYGKYFLEINYSGVIYERPFDFYRKLQTPYYDVNSEFRINGKSFYYFYKYLKNIKNPKENRIYFDTKTQVMYTYKNGVWEKVKQENIIVPQMLFPHTNLDVN